MKYAKTERRNPEQHDADVRAARVAVKAKARVENDVHWTAMAAVVDIFVPLSIDSRNIRVLGNEVWRRWGPRYPRSR